MELTQPQIGFLRNLRDFPSSITLSGIISGFIVFVIAYTGPILIVLKAAEAGGLTEAQTASWIWAIALGNGLTSIFLSLYLRIPLTAPFPTASAVLLATGLLRFTLAQAIGAYIMVAVATILIGRSGLFAKAIALVPQPIVMGMLAGILLRFGLGIFSTLPSYPVMATAMIATYFLLKRLKFRAPTLGVLIVGLLIAGVSGQLHLESVPIILTTPVFTMPEFSFDAALSLALPMLILNLTSQYAPGIGVLRFFGYDAPVNRILMINGVASTLIAPFGGHGLTLGALLAALVLNPENHPDPNRRYATGVITGMWYVVFGLFGATVVKLISGFPAALVNVVAGLGLSTTIASSLSGAMAQEETRDAALVAFLCAASDVTLLGIGAAFWALIAGMVVHLLMQWRKETVQAPQAAA